MFWTFLKIIYPMAMVPFSVSLWFASAPMFRMPGLDWRDFDHLRIICLVASFTFWILSIVSLINRHRAFPLLWAGTIFVAAAMFAVPAPSAAWLKPFLRPCLLIGLSAHLMLLFINDRCPPRAVKDT